MGRVGGCGEPSSATLQFDDAPMTKAFDQLANLSPSMRIVVLCGKESFFISEGTRLLAEALRNAFGEIDQFTFDGVTAGLSDVLDELRTYALIRRHKLVILDHADKFLAGEGRRRALEAYARNPTAEASLLMRAEAWRPGTFDKLVAKVGVKIKCDPLPDVEAVRWCVAQCPRRHGRKIERPAAALLVEQLGSGLARLDSELAKLAAFIGQRQVIRRGEVVEMVGYSRQEKAWQLQSAVVGGVPGEAVAKVRELLEVSRLSEQLVIWAIGDLLRRLHTAAQLLREGVGSQAVAQQLRLFGPTGNRMIDIARRCDLNRIAQLLQLVVRTDMRSKTGFGRADRNLEALTLLVTDTISCR